MDKLKLIIDKCTEEVEWAQANINEMETKDNPHNYTDEDKTWLPCWLKAHKQILESIKNGDV